MKSNVPAGQRFIGEDGNEYIQGSRRPDGTFRKPIRVKPGYVPPDEVNSYKSVGTRRKEATQRRGPPGLAPGLAEAANANANANAKKKKRRKKKSKAAQDGNGNGNSNASSNANADVNAATSAMAGLAVGDASNGGAAAEKKPLDKDKQLRKLRKKLRQIDALQAKIDGGEVAADSLSPEQTAKLAERANLEAEIKALEEQ